MSARADSTSFIDAYDAGRYEEAADQVLEVDVSNPGVARRLGVMYYTAKGVNEDQVKGCELLEKAMMAGDATAAINLTKIYFKAQENRPKAAWCLMVAECTGDMSVKKDVERLHAHLGDNYLKDVITYISQLRVQLAEEKLIVKKIDTEKKSLEKALAEAQTNAEKEKDMLVGKLKSAEDTMTDEKKRLEERLRVSQRDMEVARNDIDSYKKIIKTMEVDTLSKDANVEKIKANQIYDRYNQLAEKYNVLVRKYNNLLCASAGLDRKSVKE